MGHYKYLWLFEDITELWNETFNLVVPTGTKNKLCTATCSGETDEWKSYSSNGVTTTGRAYN